MERARYDSRPRLLGFLCALSLGLDGRKLDRAAIEISDEDSRALASGCRGACERLGNAQSLHLARLASDEATVAPYVPQAVYLANNVFVSEHGLTFQPRRFQSCTVGHRINLFCAGRGIGEWLSGACTLEESIVKKPMACPALTGGASFTGLCGVGPHRSGR